MYQVTVTVTFLEVTLTSLLASEVLQIKRPTDLLCYIFSISLVVFKPASFGEGLYFILKNKTKKMFFFYKCLSGARDSKDVLTKDKMLLKCLS